MTAAQHGYAGPCRGYRIVTGQQAPCNCDPTTTDAPYDREVLVNVLVYHGSTGPARCWCGWAMLGASLPEHIADVYEAAVTRRAAREVASS